MQAVGYCTSYVLYKTPNPTKTKQKKKKIK